MVLDSINGRLYVGSVNRLYKLTSDLETEEIEVTGPKDDNPDCKPPDFVQCNSTLVSTNNINKILVIDTDNSQLITCGNVYRGSCETRNMDTLDLIKWYDRQVATTSTDGSTVAIIAHGPNNDNTGLGPNVLYVGRSGVPDEARWIPLSSRLLSSNNNEVPFTILQDKVGKAGFVQLKVVNSNSALEYEDIEVVHDNPEIVQNGLLFDAENDNIYVMSKRQITKVPVENCENFTTCDDCLEVNGVGDPYCGWCTLENRFIVLPLHADECSRWNVCQGHTVISDNRCIVDFQCPSVDVDPGTVDWDKMVLLTLKLTRLPQSLSGFKCVFETIGTTNAAPTDESNVLTCTTPPPSNIPSPGSRGFLKVKLSILSEEVNDKFVSTDFYFCDCDSLKTCMTCTENNCGCDWCVFENICSKNVSSCKIEGVVRGNANEANSSQQCPQIKESAETIIPVDLPEEFYVVGENFPQPLDGQTGYECILHIEGVEVIATGERESAECIKCRSYKYMYSEDVISKLVTLQLKWNNDFEIDNPDNIQVNLYKCDVERPNCGICQQAELKYQCGWCNNVNEQKCTVVDKCNPEDSWLTREDICPNPTITKIKPEAGPIEGGTRLTIMGSNLGTNSSNVKHIDVAGLECLPQTDGYKIAEQIQCLTSASNGIQSGHVSITIGNNQRSYSGVSTSQFSYVVVKIYYIFPMKGAQSGGTKVTVVGENLNAGSNITATIAGLKCCVTDGGTTITVLGHNLNIVQTPLLRVYIDMHHYDATCKVRSSSAMLCTAPNIWASNIEPTAEQPYLVDYGFIMDNVENTTHLKDTLFGPFSYFPNPVFYPFDGVKEYRGLGEDPIVIMGENLNLAVNESDFRVMIGSEFCEVVSLAWNQLTCVPSSHPPNKGNDKRAVELWVNSYALYLDCVTVKAARSFLN
uniref:Plexin-A4-like n=1 Tax=Saccoglossus kowalevskii TaxID=10224 RepID=A0ABM0M371_SACKO|nr:PREDICTED: plexin-A4-like [Saccoglossus kowalevskii]